jgi:subtilase-type serine protease
MNIAGIGRDFNPALRSTPKKREIMYRFHSTPIARVLTLSPLHCAVIAALGFATPTFAQFSPGPNPITGTVGAQTLSNASGTITPTGAILINSGGTVPLTMSGTSTLLNNGTVQTLGGGRAIDSNTAGSSLTVTNNGLVSSVSADAFAVRQGNSSVSLTNSGTIQVTNGGQAIDWANITTGTNTLTNTGTITAFSEDAVRPGQNGSVTNTGVIRATPILDVADPGNATGSDGIDLRTQKIVTVTNSGTIEGRHGIATDGDNNRDSSLTVNNNAGGVIQARNGSGLNVDVNTTLPGALPLTVTANVTNALGATITGGLMMNTTIGDGDGIDVDGILTLNNSGQVIGVGAKGGPTMPRALPPTAATSRIRPRVRSSESRPIQTAMRPGPATAS